MSQLAKDRKQGGQVALTEADA
jgi:hypothetical protein